MTIVLQEAGILPPIQKPTLTDRQLVDRILYLASLASRREDIDPMLDTLRAITAIWREGEPLSPQSRSELTTLEAKLKQYLVHNDPLRAFTEASLNLRLQEGESQQTTTGINVNTRNLLLVLLVSFLGGGLAFIVPPYDLSFSHRALISIPFFFLILHVGIAWFYLSALNNFNQSLRYSFLYICAGIVILSLGFSHYIFLALFGLDTHPLMQYAGITWIIGFPFILFYIGLRIYAKLLNVKSRFISPVVVSVIAVAVTLIFVLMPHAPAPREDYFDFWLSGTLMIPIFALISSILARGIIKLVTPAFANSMGWLYRYLLLVGICSIPGPLLFLLLGQLNGGPLMLLITVFGLPPQLMLLYTGYSFKKATGK